MQKKTRRRLKRAAVIAPGLLVFLTAAALVVVPYATSGPALQSPAGAEAAAIEPEFQPDGEQTIPLKVMTLNVAHGRGTTGHQALRSSEEIHANLDEIAKVLTREQPHVVALQEADRPSLWSGRFDHVQYLADSAEFTDRFCGEHVKGIKTAYGTALLSQSPLHNCTAVTFSPSPPTLSKGFVVSCVAWPDQPRVHVTVVSVHLDFSRKSVRESQIENMFETLSKRHRPLIVMGDFNCQWSDDEASLRDLCEGLNVKPYKPEAESTGTFRSSGHRLDWILISPELDFVEYETLEDPVSDHLGVVATLKLAQ